MTKPHTTVATRMSGVRESWLALTNEEIIDPNLAIVDPHHHLWDFPNHRYLLPVLLADTGSGHKIESRKQLPSRQDIRAVPGVLERLPATREGCLRR
jgi:hypothetical protein